MAVCISCGQEADICLCDKCKTSVDIENLCDSIAKYTPGLGENSLWDTISTELSNSCNFKNVIFALSADLPSPKKEFKRILCMSGNSGSVSKNSRQWLYEVYEICKTTTGLSKEELIRVKGLVLDALYKDYRFTEAEELKKEIISSKELPKQVYITLADFYTKTRRYDEADTVLAEAGKAFASDAGMAFSINNLTKENQKYRDKAVSGKQEYMPNPKENKEAVRKAYVDFLISIGINAEIIVSSGSGRKSKAPTPIPRDQYPAPVEIREANFNSFVAFDIETTGFSSVIDSIIEIGAIKIVDGNIVDSAEFTFQEFVKPYKRSIKQEITELTGIRPEDVANARKMWEVAPDFMKFVGDSILVGFNSIGFDSKFLVRAGRYSHLIIENPHFDVMRYADQFKEKLGIDDKKYSLEKLAEKLGIENSQKHRALADAVTTAKVYLKLKEMDSSTAEASVDDVLADIEDW